MINQLCRLAAVCLVFLSMLTGIVACQQYSDIQSRTAGTAIRFGASTGYANGAATKTEYSGMDENGNGISSASVRERIDWVAGTDRIRILCTASGNGPTADYEITGTPAVSGPNSSAGITPVEANGLQWGEGDHYFFAMYPAPGMQSNYSFTDNNPVAESKTRLENSPLLPFRHPGINFYQPKRYTQCLVIGC